MGFLSGRVPMLQEHDVPGPGLESPGVLDSSLVDVVLSRFLVMLLRASLSLS